MLQISSATREVFVDQQRTIWRRHAADRLHDTYLRYFSALNVAATDLVPVCHAVERWAAEHGIDGKRDLYRLSLCAISMGHQFWRDPRFYRYVADSLGNSNIVPTRRAQAMTNHVQPWLRLLWHDDDLGRFSERLARSVRLGATPDTSVLRTVLPGHWQLFGTTENDRYLAWLMQGLPEHRFPAPFQQLACLSCSLVHGAGWLNDPQYPALIRAIETAGDAPLLADRLLALYGAMV